METSKKNDSVESNKTKELSCHERLIIECKSLLHYAFKAGKSIDSGRVSLLDNKLGADKSEDGTDQLLDLYNYLLDVVKPATPCTISALEQNEKKHQLLRILGPLPIVRQFMIMAILSLIALIVTSLSTHVNLESINLSMLEGYGMNQIYRLAFLMACASVGSSFYALFKINSYLVKERFNISLSHTYWSRYVLGIVSGLLLSELFVSFIDSSDSASDSFSYLLKPILAILGGFSADLVYRIINRLVGTVESLFKGETEEIIAQKEYEYKLQSKEKTNKMQNIATQQILSLKQSLVEADMPKEVLNQLDDTLSEMIKGKASYRGNAE